MSKLIVCLVLLLSTLSAAGQELDVRIRVDAASPTTALIEGHYLNNDTPRLSFLTTYAGLKDLPARTSDVKVADADKKDIAVTKTPSGEFLGERPVRWFAYKVDLTQQKNVLNAAHVSWADGTGGMLALDDLLPQPTNKLRLRLTLDVPPGWRVITRERHLTGSILEIDDAERAVICFGSGWSLVPAGSSLQVAIEGDIGVADALAASRAAEVYSAYKKLFGSEPPGSPSLVAIAKLGGTSPGAWEAQTRGSTVTIITGGGLSTSDAEQRLLQQLRHELFHLWVPNGMNLTGNYDWFYEGFATYEEQKLGVAMNQIRFTDFLSTLGRAYDIDRFSGGRGSLVETSQNRWVGSSGQVYARGMLVAFLCDVALLDASKGKSSAETLLKQLFDAHRIPAAPADGNDTILALMRSRSELRRIADDYIAGSKSVDWVPYLQKAGLDAQVRDQLTSVSVVAKPNGHQKDLLDKLGYNSWLKLAPK